MTLHHVTLQQEDICSLILIYIHLSHHLVKYRRKLSVYPPMVFFPFLFLHTIPLSCCEVRFSVGTDLFSICIRRACICPYVCVPRHSYSQSQNPSLIILCISKQPRLLPCHTVGVQSSIPSQWTCSWPTENWQLGLGEAEVQRDASCSCESVPGSRWCLMSNSRFQQGLKLLLSARFTAQKGKSFRGQTVL